MNSRERETSISCPNSNIFDEIQKNKNKPSNIEIVPVESKVSVSNYIIYHI